MAERSNPHDEFFKFALGRPETARDFLSHYLPAEVAAQLDLATVELAPGSFVDARLRAHLSDLLYVVLNILKRCCATWRQAPAG